jgi:hypothetical protein
MNRLVHIARRLLLAAGFALSLSTPLVAQAGPLTFAPFAGAGNLSVFDAAAGTGGWVGSIDEVPPSASGELLSLVSVVLFNLDSATQALTGTFEFTTTDLASTLFGELSGMADSADFLSLGGQLSLDYNILGGSGRFSGASGFGLAFFSYDPAGGFNNYSEDGLLVFSVPEPGSLALAGLGLLAAAGSRRRARPGVARP